MAKETSKEVKVETEAEVKVETEEKMVKIKLPRERGENTDVFVGVNGRNWLIKRGVEVTVPECVAEVLRLKEDALDEAYEFENSSVKD